MYIKKISCRTKRKVRQLIFVFKAIYSCKYCYFHPSVSASGYIDSKNTVPHRFPHTDSDLFLRAVSVNDHNLFLIS